MGILKSWPHNFAAFRCIVRRATSMLHKCRRRTKKVIGDDWELAARTHSSFIGALCAEVWVGVIFTLGCVLWTGNLGAFVFVPYVREMYPQTPDACVHGDKKKKWQSACIKGACGTFPSWSDMASKPCYMSGDMKYWDNRHKVLSDQLKISQYMWR